ncbi:GNAT family N-acetyltransferase [Actinokineospora pegani]|uniref:GNAT family N-acetyltransferase n=1 Tax=Actinokineospora pegani TaxID=2654637 RepID=UPI001F338741|nr:GNAT family N-acetyltransferase [Actinokineospora pegani]
MLPPQRKAVDADIPSIAALMRRSVLDLFPAFYDDRQVASAAVHIAALDRDLVHDGTYYVHEHDGELVACGGWSRRDKLYAGPAANPDDDRLLDPASEPARIRAMFVRQDWTRRGLARAIIDTCTAAASAAGFRSLALMATLPGVALYRAAGFAEVEAATIHLPDGVALGGVSMTRTLGGFPIGDDG